MGNMNNKKIKYRKDDEKQIALGVKVTVDAYERSKKTKFLCDAVKRALKQLDVRDIARLPREESIQNHVNELIKAIESQTRPEGTNGRSIVISRAYDEITGGQVPMSMPGSDDDQVMEDVSVSGLCEQENVASQCDECTEEEADTIENAGTSELSLTAKDKKEIAMYAIDQHYFFLKQLTGVI
jgi:hypothetical protein